MLANQGQGLSALQRLELPPGQSSRLASIALPRLPCLEVLLVHCGPGGFDGGLNVAGIGWLKELLESLPGRLLLLEIEALAVDVATATLQAVFGEAATRPQRLVLKGCVLPDSAMKCICEALPEVEVSWDAWSEPAVRLEDCHLSSLAEQHLLQTLEKCCTVAVSLEGGSRHELSCDVPAWLEDAPCPGTEPRVQNNSCNDDASSDPGVFVQAPGPKREYDHVDQMTTAELMEVVLRRMQTDAQGSASQVSRFANMLLARAESSATEPEAFGGINDPSDDEDDAADVGAGIAALQQDRAEIERLRMPQEGTVHEATQARRIQSWSMVD